MERRVVESEVEYETIGSNDTLLEEIASSYSKSHDPKLREKTFSHIIDFEKGHVDYVKEVNNFLKKTKKELNKIYKDERKYLEKNLSSSVIDSELREKMQTDLDSIKDREMNDLVKILAEKFKGIEGLDQYNKQIETLRNKSDIKQTTIEDLRWFCREKYLEFNLSKDEHKKIMRNHFNGFLGLEATLQNNYRSNRSILRKKTILDPFNRMDVFPGMPIAFFYILTAGAGVGISYGIQKAVHLTKWTFANRRSKKLNKNEIEALRGSTAYALMNPEEKR